MIDKKKFLKIILICLVISLFLEIFIFNFRFFTTLNYKKTDLTNNITYHNLEPKENKIVIGESGNEYIEIKNIDQVANNIKLNFKNISGTGYLNYQIYATDAANKNYFSLPARYLYPTIEKSKYVKLDLLGKTNKLRIEFQNNQTPLSFDLIGISINEKVPIDISFTRLILVFVALVIVYIIRPKSELYKYKINFQNENHVKIIIATIAGLALIFLYVVNINPGLKNPPTNHNQYQDLAEAFSKGQVSLLEKPSKILKNMKNPYDCYERERLAEKYGNFSLWDRAYYKGKYYVYFGVVPVISAYLPYYLLMGTHIPNYILGYIVMVMTIIGMALFLKEIVKKYFKNIPLLLYLLLLTFMAFGPIFIMQYPGIYTMPVAFSYMFTYFGLFFILSAIDKHKLSTPRLFLGSLCMALVAGCRPQFLIGSFLLIPILWKPIFKDRTLFSKKSIKQTLAFVLPYIIVGVLLMLYNYIRFESIFDFGANYNVTNNDMTKRGFRLGRIGFGLFTALFQPPVINSIYPFLYNTATINNYMGTTITEPCFGGLLFTNLTLWLGVLFPKFKKYLPKVIYYMCFISIIGGLLIIIFDVEGAGVFQRYALDYSWLFILAAVLVIMSLFNSRLDKNLKKYLLIFVVLTIAGSLLFQCLDLLNDKLYYNMINSNPFFYFKWYYLLQWWL